MSKFEETLKQKSKVRDEISTALATYLKSKVINKLENSDFTTGNPYRPKAVCGLVNNIAAKNLL